MKKIGFPFGLTVRPSFSTYCCLLLGALMGPLAQAQRAAPPAPARTPTTATPEAEPPAQSRLDAELFYQLLLGELNTFGGEPGAGYALVLEAARKTNDAKVFERAISMALQNRSGEPALVAARAWQKAMPASREANRYILQILIGLNRIGEAAAPLKAEIAMAPAAERLIAINSIPRLLARASDKKLAASVAEQALADQLTQAATGAAAWVAVGRMRLEAGDTAGVLEAAKRAQSLESGSEGAAGLALAVMSPSTKGAEEIVQKYLSGKPTVDVRMGYARALVEAQRYPQAITQLQILITEQPKHPQAWLVLGSLQLQERKFDLAEKSLQQHVEVATQTPFGNRSAELNRGLAQAYLALAQLAEQKKDLVLAESWLARIDNPEEMVNAQSRRASLLAKQGKLDEARKLIRSLPEKLPSDGRMKLMAEIQLLRDNKQFRAAYDLITEKTKTGAFDHELIYDQAVLAEKLGNLDEMEILLRKIIAVKADYQAAYNALGYSLADRNVRLPEAKVLIQKALELAPGDPFITDSLGWVEFRAGNMVEAQRILEGAFKARPDAEIAAHLGEVLWISGKKEQALAIWREGVALNAENDTLVETLKRFRVKL